MGFKKAMGSILFLLAFSTSVFTEQKTPSARIYMTWKIHEIGNVPCCPDGEYYTSDPYTGKSILKDCGKRGMVCDGDLIKEKHKSFASKQEAENFKIGCSSPTCTDWKMRTATDWEFLAQQANDRHWVVSIKGGKKYWEVADLNNPDAFADPIAIGHSPEEAMRSALALEAKNNDHPR